MKLELNPLIEAALLGARLARPYYARALAALTPVERPGLNTMAVDQYWRLYYDPEWLAALTPEHQASVIGAHEVEHLLRDHHARAARCLAEPHAWNICADCEINDDVPAEELPPKGVRPATIGQPDGLLAEEYLDAAEKSDGSGCCGGGTGSGGNPVLGGEEPAPEDGGPPGLSPAEAERVRDQVAADVRAHIAQHGRGSIPEGIAVWAEARAHHARVDWRRELAGLVGRATAAVRGRQDYSWARLSRRSWATPGGPLRPGTISYPPRVAVLADTSGSMLERGEAVLSEISALLQSHRPTIYSCDAAAQRVRGRTYVGGGGTDMGVGLGLIAQARPRPDAVVVLTDGLTPWPTEATPFRTIVCLFGQEKETVCPPWADRIEVRP